MLNEYLLNEWNIDFIHLTNSLWAPSMYKPYMYADGINVIQYGSCFQE